MGTNVLRLVVLLALLGAASVRAHAAEDARAPDPMETAADAASRAAKAKDADALAHVAAARDPDPWLVVETMLVRGETEAARAFAAAVPAPWGPGLRRRLDDPPPRAATLTALRDVRAATCARRFNDALAVADRAAPGLGDDPASLAVRLERAVALAGLRRHDEAALAARTAADQAEGLRWWRAAARARHLAALETLYLAPRTAIARWHDLERVARATGDEDLRATALEGLATADERSADLLGALPAVEEAVALRARLGVPGPWARAEAAHGAILLRSGRSEEAMEVLERAAARAKAADDAPTQVAALAGLGSARLLRGEAGAAVRLLARAAELARAADAQDQTARVLVNLAGARRALGDIATALDDMRAADELFRRTGDVQGRVRALLTVALLRLDVGDVEGALRAGETALGLAKSSGDAEGASLACSRVVCGLVSTDDTEAGEAFLARCALLPGVDVDPLLATARRVASARTPADARAAARDLERLRAEARKRGDDAGAARFLLQTAAMALVAGDVEGARTRYDEVAQEARALHDARLLAAALAGVASCHLAAGAARAALAAAANAVEHVEGLVKGLGDEDAAMARAAWRDVFTLGAVAAVKERDAAWEHWFLEAGRAGALLEALGARDVAAALEVPEALTAALAAADAAEAGAKAALAGAEAAGDRARATTLRAEHDAAAARLRQADEAVARARKAGARFYPQPAPLRVVQATLREDEALVVYATLAGQAGALVVGRRDAAHVDLGPASALAAATAGATSFDPDAPAAAARAALDAARRALVAPLRLTDACKRVIVVPDGELAYVPFGALLPEREVALVPSATTWLKLRDLDGAPGKGVLALGGPDYGAAGPGGARGPAMSPLPGTAREARAVGDAVLVGADATVPRMRRALASRPRWRAVHLGCHGVIDPDHPALTALYLTPSPDHDGRLRVCDLLRETISADLVVLSACQTGRGHVVRAEGVLGLARAVMHAGAPRVLASLWKVDDAATERLMTEFHAAYRAGAPAAAALKAAQARLRDDPRFAHPAAWAGFVLWGLPR